ncbi:hypothetical protein Vadar_013245 [Vaccinium darrowii]|uniref:Uncharacterized protein n=1 Tax=Vaccinium darrowii TaxID=229202 RepID=A0ACB7ZBH2_9ERIC|nr:hypothetical protein Vadar_013245 [Vaccinium darrowii]
MTRKNAYWLVYVGRKLGIYMTWKEAQYQVDGYPNNKHERIKLFDEAQEALCKFHEDSYYGEDIGRNRTEHEASVDTSTSAMPLEDQFMVEREANVRPLVLVTSRHRVRPKAARPRPKFFSSNIRYCARKATPEMKSFGANLNFK